MNYRYYKVTEISLIVYSLYSLDLFNLIIEGLIINLTNFDHYVFFIIIYHF